MWKAYEVRLRLVSQIHIGHRKLGNVQSTRPYVTGRNFWGALTARMAREAGADYGAMGERVQEELAFTYFFVSGEKGVALWPWEKAREFEWLYLGSYASTALKDGHGAEQGTLHETEYIAATRRDGGGVWLRGCIFEREGCGLPWRAALDRLQFGGERAYGWGRVRCEDIAPAANCFGLTVVADGPRPVIEVPPGESLLAHARCAGLPDGAEGSIEPLVGRITGAAGDFGGRPSQAVICWAPGTKFQTAHKMSVGRFGIWEGRA